MFKHYLLTAWRNFLRYKLITAINVLGLALGLACSIAAIGTHAYFKSADQNLPNADRIVMILERYSDTLNSLHGPLMTSITSAVPIAMRKEFPNLPIAYVNGIGTIPVDVDGRREFVNAAAADDGYLDILDFPRTQLQPGNPLKTPRTVVLAESAATQLFGDEQPTGRTIRLQGVLDVTVAAVLKSSDLPSHGLGPNGAFKVAGILIGRDTARALSAAVTGKLYQEPPLAVQWQFIAFGSALYAQLPADGSLTGATLEQRLRGLPERNGAPPAIKAEIRVVSLSEAWISEMNMNLFKGSTSLSVVELIIVLGIVALVVAVANYINMSVAQAGARTKETGLRRVIGASRSQLISQIAVEIAAHLLVAAFLAACAAVFIGQLLESYTGLPLLGSVLQSERFWAQSSLALLAMLILLTLSRFVGVTLVKPSDALRDGSARQGRGFGAYALLGAQFLMISVLVVVMIVGGAQNHRAHELAAQTSSDVLVRLDSSFRRGGARFDVWRTELLGSPAIKGVTSSSSPPWRGNLGLQPLRTLGDQVMNPNSTSVSYDFEKVLDYRIVAGRSFSADYGDLQSLEGSAPSVLIDETLARALGFRDPSAAVGKGIRRGGFSASLPPLSVVGVVADKPMRLQPMLDFVGTLYLVDNGDHGDLVVRIDKQRVAEGVAAIDAVWRKLAPKEKIKREFADESFARAYGIYDLIGNVLTGVAFVALSVAMMGGFGFALFATQRRAREIGVRKTLGANAGQVFGMLLRDYSRPVVVANVLGWPLAYVAAQRYLSTFEQPISFSPWYLAASVVFTLLIAWIAVSHLTWRAARLQPADVLRHE